MLRVERTDEAFFSRFYSCFQTRDGVGKCTPDDGPVDVELGLADLATIYMGAHRPSQLSRAGRITEVRDGALNDLEAAFSTARAPYCGTLF